MNLRTYLYIFAEQLVNVSDTPYLDTELLLATVLNVTRTYLHSHPEQQLSPQQKNYFEKLIKRRLNGEPVAYILNQQPFWTINLQINKDVLIPRPETEVIIEIILEKFSQTDACEIADLGTGSGAIALALAHECPRWYLTATDICPAALKIAKENAKRLDLNNVEFWQGNWCDALPEKKYNAIVSNPPYVPENDPHLASLSYEPRLALVSGTQGLDAISKITKQAPKYLDSNGVLLLEHGFDQAPAVRGILKENGYGNICTYCDLGGQERVTSATL